MYNRAPIWIVQNWSKKSLKSVLKSSPSKTPMEKIRHHVCMNGDFSDFSEAGKTYGMG